MRKTMWTSGIAALIVAFGVGMTAQTPSSDQSKSSSSDSKSSVTLTGCLQSGETAGTTGSATPSTRPGSSASSSSDRFILANAKTGSASSSSSAASPSSTTGTAGSASSASSMSGKSYVLEGDASELSKHVGHEIEVTGRLDNSSKPESSSTAGAPSTSPSTPSSSSAAGIQKVHVQSVKMISSSCSAR